MKGFHLFRKKMLRAMGLLCAGVFMQAFEVSAAIPPAPDVNFGVTPDPEYDDGVPPDIEADPPPAGARASPVFGNKASLLSRHRNKEQEEADKEVIPSPKKHLQWLINAGVTPQLTYTAESAANPVGGIRHGSAYSAQLMMGLDLDTDRLVGLKGGTIRFYVTNRHGQNLANTAIGNNTSVQEIWGTQNTHLAEFTWNQKLFNNHLELVAGRMSGNAGAFFSSSIYCNFQSNSACGNPTMIFKDSNFTYWPASAWGGYFKAWITPKIYFEGGAFEVNPYRKRANDDGFTFSIKHATGAMAPFELAYTTNFSNDKLPRTYRIGGWYDGGDYTDPVLDANRKYAVMTGDPYATLNGRGGIFFRFDQMIWRPNMNSERGLTVFGVAMKNVAGRVAEDHFLEIGFVQTGTFKGRDKDVLGFMINDQRMSKWTIDNILVARTSAGGSRHVPRDEIMMELTYGAQISRAFRVSPNLQYIINPDQIAEPFRTKNIKNTFIVGLKFTLDVLSHFNIARNPN